MPDKLPHARRSELTRAVIDRLAAIDTHGSRVLSVYLGFDPSQMPNLRERRMEVDALIAEAERRWDGQGQTSHADRMALRESIETVRRLFADERELAPESARGLAVFCAAPAGLCEVVSLPEPVDPMVALEERPFIEPLLELASPERWCVLLVSHRSGRIFTGTRARLIEVAQVRDEVHRHHEQGGWSQARYQRGVETETDWHIHGTCDRLLERFKRRPFDRLLLGGPEELHHRVEAALHRDLRERLAGCFEIDVERSAATEVQQHALPLIEDGERRREDEALRHVEEGLSPSGHSAVGLDEVLEALNERRVGTLIVAHAYAAPGFQCPSCDRLATSSNPCPLDGAAPEHREDIVESSLEAALQAGSDVMIVRHLGERLASHGSIAALLRF